jgi:hypothetical protein
MKDKKFFHRRWRSVFTALVVLAWFAVPLIGFFTASSASNPPHPPQLKLQAALSGTPINNVSPFGIAEYKLESDNLRKFELEIFSVNLPAGTNLDVYVNNNLIGQIRVNSSQTGELELRSDRQQNTPTIHAGDVITIRQGSTNILSGTFTSSGTPTPTVSPSGSPTASPTGSPTACADGPLFATLTGAPINGRVPRGFAQFRNSNNNQLKVFVRFLNLPDDTVLDVFVGGTDVGDIQLRDNGNGHVFIDTQMNIAPGTVITIRNGNTTVLSGTFFCTNPTPSPSPSVSPTASPSVSPTVSPSVSPTASPTVSPTVSPTASPTASPSPTPNQSRLFKAKLRGNQVVPQVQTQARGFAFALLNEAGTQLQVSAGFFGLSSNQTTASINCPALPGQNAPAVFNLGTAGGRSGFLPVQTFAVTTEQAAQLRAGLCYVIIGSVNNPSGEIRGQLRAVHIGGDFEGDGLYDVSVFRPSDGNWYSLDSSDGSFRGQHFGLAGDKAVLGDYDGDGIGDLSVFRPSNGYWYIQRSSDGSFAAEQWGTNGDIPVAADFDGDDRTDLAVFRPSEGMWYIRYSSNGTYSGIRWGLNGDVPVVGDYDGDGRNDIAVFRPSNGTWYINRSSDGALGAVRWGASGDIPQSGDFDGDGVTDIALFRPTDGTWYILRSIDGDYRVVRFGMNGDIPVAGNFDADRKTDIAVFRPADGTWYILRSDGNEFVAFRFGQNGDQPVSAVNAP